MGRLQKKKAPGGKKTSTSNLSASSPGKLTIGKSAASAALSARDSKKRTVPSRKKAAAGAISTTGSKPKYYLDMAVQFLREVVMELKKVTWPSRKQTTGSTIVMIILVAIFSVFLGTVDIGLSKFIQIILQ
jgi:preprotein translocase subunit SecE